MHALRVPTYGTSAYKYEEFETQKKSVKKGVSKKQKSRAYRKKAVMVIMVTALAFILLFRYAAITEMTSRLAAMKAEYDSVSSLAVSKECALRETVDLRKVEQIATTELGMQRPEKHQIVYINMQNTDYTEMPQSPKRGGGFFAAVSGGIKSLWEYFN